MQKKTKGKTNKKIIRKILIIIVIILTILSFVLATIQFEFFSRFSNITKKEQLFKIDDQCSLIMGKLIHQIKNEGDCKLYCNNECNIRKMKFYNSEFLYNEKDCNTCDCYCK